MAIFDTTGIIYLFFESFTNNITGSWTLTLVACILFALLVCLVLRIPIEFSALFVFPLSIYFIAFDSATMAIVGVLIVYLAFLLAKNFFFWRN